MNIEGKIQWLPEAPTEYPEGSGKYSLGIKINNAFYNKEGEASNLSDYLKTLKKGYEVKIEVIDNKIQSLEILNDKVEEKSDWADDMTKFEDLLADAHTKGLVSIFTVPVEVNPDKKYALFKAVVMMQEKDGIKKEFQAHGDATSENIKGDMIKPHFIRMAETRAISRALRWATNNAKVAVEETQ